MATRRRSVFLVVGVLSALVGGGLGWRDASATAPAAAMPASATAPKVAAHEVATHEPATTMPVPLTFTRPGD